MDDAATTRTLPDVAEEGARLAEAARAASLALRLVGGVAFWVRCPSARRAPLAREYGDVDFVGRSADRRAIAEFMTSQGYEADKLFNALHGATRLNFHDPERGRPVDVLLDRFSMAHELDLEERLETGSTSLSLADLLLTKLQVVDLNRKDLLDIAALLLDHDLAELDVSRILDVTHSDWGFEHTIHRTLSALQERLGELGLSADAAATVSERAAELRAALDAAPKSTAWKLRARVGERMRWYAVPEEARPAG
jgi:hypothetical protein